MSLSFLVRQSSGLSWPIYLLIPSGNQTWQLKIHPYSYRYCPIKASIYRGCSIATSDYWKVYVLVCIHFASACLCVHECGWIWGVWLHCSSSQYFASFFLHLCVICFWFLVNSAKHAPPPCQCEWWLWGAGGRSYWEVAVESHCRVLLPKGNDQISSIAIDSWICWWWLLMVADEIRKIRQEIQQVHPCSEINGHSNDAPYCKNQGKKKRGQDPFCNFSTATWHRPEFHDVCHRFKKGFQVPRRSP